MRFGSVCSGIEAASVAWGPLGWKAAWLSEIEPFPSAVLAHHYPDVPNLGDMTALPERIRSGEVEAPDLFCGGTPCQAFSVAGLRNSLDDARGNLSLTFCEIANAIDNARSVRGLDPSIVFWENVPGVLSTKDNAFGCFLGALAGEDEALVAPGGRWTNAGFIDGPQRAVAWRVLDAQYFGVAQRRRRVFVVASARNDFDPAAVLFEFDGMRRDSAPSREAGQNTTGGATTGAPFGGMSPVAGTLTANTGGMTRPAGNANELDFCVPVASPVPVGIFQDSEFGVAQYDSAGTLRAGRIPEHQMVMQPVAVAQPAIGWDEELNASTEQSGTLLRGGQGGRHDGVMTPAMQVRRLTPRECEALQGFPQDYTAIPWRKKPASECPDGPRYKALGNSWAVPVVRWIGERIAKAARLSKFSR